MNPLFVLYHFNVTLTNGEIVPMNAFGQKFYANSIAISSAYTDYLRPREKTLEEFPLSKLYDLKPGIYKVFAMTDVRRQMERFSGTNEWQKIVSNEIEIIIK